MKPIQYPVPWDQVYSLWPHIVKGTRRNVDDFSANIVAKMQPPPLIEGLEHLPQDPRFILVANHYQRKGLWIIHVASVLTQAIANHYGRQVDPPVHWMVTANWPPIKIGPWKFSSPGDKLLPRVAHALHCFPVSFAGNNPAYTASTLKRILKASDHLERPIGIFPEGVAGSAGKLSPPLPGIDRLLVMLAKRGWPVLPAGISESGRFVVRFGPLVRPAEIIDCDDAARLVMARVADKMD